MLSNDALTRSLKFLAVAFLAASLAGCATPPSDPEARAVYDEANDPIEPLNRGIFSVNKIFDEVVLKPIADTYGKVVPEYGRERIRNIVNNMRSPVIFLNDVLQGQLARAGTTASRFLINSTLGIGGIWDVAVEWGMEFHTEDFGQTLAVWGAGEGPYLFLPVLGPSNIRDTVGLVVDTLADPWSYLWAAIGAEYASNVRTGMRIVDERQRNIDVLEDIERTSVDYYAALRSLNRQRRLDEINNGTPTINLPVPSLTLDMPDDPASKKPVVQAR